MTRKKSVLDSVRAALARQPGHEPGREPARYRAVAERIANPPLHPRPSCAKVAIEDREPQLIRCLESQGTDVIDIAGLASLPAAIDDYLSRQSVIERSNENPVPHLVVSDDARFASLPWAATRHASRPRRWIPGDTLGDGEAALTHALAAVAETGTLMLASAAGNPASMTFLPELHLVAVSRETIVGSFEEAFARLRASVAEARLPRAVNLVSGPSRTGDIGGRIVKGAHGPRRLAVIIYGPPAAPSGPAAARET